MRSRSLNIERQYAILFPIILAFVFPVALRATARTSNTATMTGTTVMGNGTQAVSTSAAVAVPVINFADGFAGSPSKVTLKGDAQLSGSAIQLTAANSNQAGATWSATLLSVQSFTTDFTFQLTDASADGFTFAIQNNNNTVVGGSGGGLGYASIPNSVAVKFDLYSNEGEGSDSTGLYTHGANPMMPAVDMTSSGVNLHSGHTMAVHMVYNGTRLTMAITDTVTKAFFSTSWVINIPATVGADNAYVGFTGGTGGHTAIQKILSWTYSTVAILPAPVFSLASGSYPSARTVTLSDAIPGTNIHYTTDGSAPTTSSAVYSGPITVSSNKTLNAMAVGSGYTNSTAATAAYIINATSAATPAFNFPSGFANSQDQFTILGSAQLNGSAIELTDGNEYEAGAAWYATPVNVQSFTSNFNFQLTKPSADGFTFVIHTNSDSIVGNSGGSLGYAPIPSSVAVKFDLYNTAGEGTDSTGLYTDGALPTVPAVDMTSSGVNLHSGDIMAVQLVYNGTTLTLTITDLATNASFSTSWTIDIPATVRADTAYVGFTGGTGGLASIQKILSWTYSTSSGSSPSTSLPMPTFSVAAGTYSSAQTVTISDATSGATIYYTANGTTPTTSSTKYSKPITVSSTETLKAIAAKSGYANSPVATAAYTISSASSALPAPTFSVAAGSYRSTQAVAISDAASGAIIYYTTNGTTPTTSSTKYSGAIAVSSSETVEAIAVESGYTNSAVASATYTISSASSALPAPTFSLPAGSYSSTQTVAISDTTGVTIYYTTDGTTPTTSSTQYSGFIIVSSNETLGAIAVEPGYTNSPVAVATYTIGSGGGCYFCASTVAATPTFSPAAGIYSSAQTVTISDATSGATIYYSTNGTTPTTSSTVYAGPITVSSSQTLEAIAVASGYTNSAVATATYTINPGVPAAATPTFSPAAGTYSSAQAVTISDATSGATIYYTTNGTTPSTSSTKYTGAITVSSTETLQAIAVATGQTNSAVAVATYTINPPGSSGSTSPINCPSGFSSSGSCGVAFPGAGSLPFQVAGTANGSSPSLSGSLVDLMPSGTTHAALSLNYQTQVNVQAFTAMFTFVPNGWNIAFVLNNSNNNPYFNGKDFSAGAGCEAGFFQGFSQAAPPNNVFAVELDSYSPLTASGSFTYSSAQIYQSGQSPCLPSLGGTNFTYKPITKISTSPVPLNSPANGQMTTTGDTYSATLAYNASSLTLSLFDVTKGGSCPGSSCFTYTWTGVNIPSYVGGNTAWVGITAATNVPSDSPLYVKSFVYDVNQ